MRARRHEIRRIFRRRRGRHRPRRLHRGRRARAAGARRWSSCPPWAGVTDRLLGARRSRASDGHDEAVQRRRRRRLASGTSTRRPASALDGRPLLARSTAPLRRPAQRRSTASSSGAPPIRRSLDVDRRDRRAARAAVLVAAAMAARGLPAAWVDARDVIVTDDRYTCAAPLMRRNRRRRRRPAIAPLVGSGAIPVLGGFIGRTADGATTTLGRGGSDYSASLVGAAIDADGDPDLDRRGRHADRGSRASWTTPRSCRTCRSRKPRNWRTSAPRCCTRARSSRRSRATSRSAS